MIFKNIFINRIIKATEKRTAIYEALLEEGFKVSYSTISRIANNLEAKVQEAYINQEYVPGNAVGVWFGNCKKFIYINVI